MYAIRSYYAYLITFVVVVSIFILALKYVLKPLSLIQQQTTEIEKHHFNKVIPLPKTARITSYNVCYTKLLRKKYYAQSQTR